MRSVQLVALPPRPWTNSAGSAVAGSSAGACAHRQRAVGDEDVLARPRRRQRREQLVGGARAAVVVRSSGVEVRGEATVHSVEGRTDHGLARVVPHLGRAGQPLAALDRRPHRPARRRRRALADGVTDTASTSTRCSVRARRRARAIVAARDDAVRTADVGRPVGGAGERQVARASASRWPRGRARRPMTTSRAIASRGADVVRVVAHRRSPGVGARRRAPAGCRAADASTSVRNARPGTASGRGSRAARRSPRRARAIRRCSRPRAQPRGGHDRRLGHGLLDQLDAAGLEADAELQPQDAVHRARDDDLVAVGGEHEPQRCRGPPVSSGTDDRGPRTPGTTRRAARPRWPASSAGVRCTSFTVGRLRGSFTATPGVREPYRRNAPVSRALTGFRSTRRLTQRVADPVQREPPGDRDSADYRPVRFRPCQSCPTPVGPPRAGSACRAASAAPSCSTPRARCSSPRATTPPRWTTSPRPPG